MSSPTQKNAAEEPSLLSRTIKLIKDNFIFGAPMLYLIGVIAVTARNLSAGLPFADISIVQCVSIAMYLFIFLLPIVLFEMINYDICKKYSQSDCLRRTVRFIKYVGIKTLITIFTLTIAVWTIVLNSLLEASVITIFTYLIMLFSVKLTDIMFSLKLMLYAFAAFLTLLRLPMYAGGLRGYAVNFCRIEAGGESCQEYTYYGASNGYYQLKNGNIVKLMPIDSGYIKYDKDNIIHP